MATKARAFYPPPVFGPCVVGPLDCLCYILVPLSTFGYTNVVAQAKSVLLCLYARKNCLTYVFALATS